LAVRRTCAPNMTNIVAKADARVRIGRVGLGSRDAAEDRHAAL
jgi:hypothetical protein